MGQCIVCVVRSRSDLSQHEKLNVTTSEVHPVQATGRDRCRSDFGMETYSEVLAEHAGIVVSIPAKDGVLVYEGTPLVIIKPD